MVKSVFAIAIWFMLKNLSNSLATNKRNRIILYHMNIYVAVNLNLYKYFFAVIEEHGVTKAANRLGVSQSTVSYSIHALERELGVELFRVTRGGTVPLQSAVILYRQIKPLYLNMMHHIAEFME